MIVVTGAAGFVGSHTVWEGAVWIRGKQAGNAVNGNGCVELTGYAISMQNKF